MKYHFLSDIVVRNPFYSYKTYDPGKIGEVLQDEFFLVALYLASPQLYHLLEAKRFDAGALSARERLSVLRYYNRMCFRPTPFGGFASFTLAEWGPGNSIRLEGKKRALLHLNLDREAVLRLAGRFEGREWEKYTYTVNPALYKAGGEFRFIKTNYTGNKILFALESYACNALTAALIGFCPGRTGTGIINFITVKTGCDRPSAVDYLVFLAGAQVIIPDTALNIIGEDYLLRLPEMAELCDEMRAVKLPGIDKLGAWAGQVNELAGGEKMDRVFYAGLERRVASGTLDSKYREQIMEGLNALRLLVKPAQPLMLQAFIRDFKARYDRQKVPLLQALDPETGIGYGQLTRPADEPELLQRVSFRVPREDTVALDWSALHRLLLRRWNENGAGCISLGDTDLKAIDPAQTVSSPPSLAVMFRVTDNEIFLEAAGGVTATALIGRFTAWSPVIHRLGRRLAALEQAASPGVVFADIGQLSDAHADNINRRQHCYAYEILVNSVSTLAPDKQVPLSDLWLSVVGDRLVLESGRLGKVIIPRLVSAYNHSHNQLPAFRLLCDLQYQGIQGNYTFDLEAYFPGMAFYPRVVFNQVILSPARWHLTTATELEKLKLPQWVALTRHDQQLVFNMKKKEEVVFLRECLKGMDKAVLHEFYLPEGDLVSQYVSFLYREDEVYTGRVEAAITRAQPEFILGSKWLYLKLYSNPGIANELLVKKLLPLLQQLNKTGLLSWFFVRYNDSGPHIRLRLKVREAFIGPVLSGLKKRLAGTVRYQLIREYQADTYRRELERYGPDIIGLVEDFFYGSSELVIRYIQVSGRRSFPCRYHSLAFVSAGYLVSRFLPELNERISFLEQMVHTFYTEFSGDKTLKVGLDRKYRELKNELSALLTDNDYYKKLKLLEWSGLFSAKTAAVLKAAAGFTAKRKNQLLADLVHMHLNRLFPDRQRQQELVVYYGLYKYSLSVKAIALSPPGL